MRVLLVLLLALIVSGCTTSPEMYYRAPESALEVIAVLRRHIPDDTYRFEPARDFTDRNVYRASLLRLENIEKIHADSLRAGHMDPVLAFAKARALERLRAYDLAAENYHLVANFKNSELRSEALRSAALCDALTEARDFEFLRTSPFSDDRLDDFPETPEQAQAIFDKRLALLQALLPETKGTHYRFIVQEEVEHADVSRAHYFGSERHRIANGNRRAIAVHQELIQKHRESKRVRQHLITLGDLYAELAQEYIDRNPPETLNFDPVSFRGFVDSATRIYENVANRDGSPEKLEAARKLEAFLAFTLRVDRDRFTP